jgi:2-polyprenyl-6-hydroxyphenyl methylase/3-demethylubiquinone-9 3-methyltransferase
MLGVESLEGKTFLDIGSGSGLFSLVARRLGASVRSFDYDPYSVACTRELKRRYFNSDSNWQIESGSVLDVTYLKSLGRFDIVYSWGVLHHTGSMWQALENVNANVADQGILFVAIYNDQGLRSEIWLKIKKLYNRLLPPFNYLFAVLVYFPFEIRKFTGHVIKGRPLGYFYEIANYRKNRGMSWLHDRFDWIGGLPFEVSKPEKIFEFYQVRGYMLEKLVTCGGAVGCNQLVLRKLAE